MGGLLSGLGRFGLDSLEGMDLYGKPKQEEKEKKVEEKGGSCSSGTGFVV